jgi:hypothetical protein
VLYCFAGSNRNPGHRSNLHRNSKSRGGIQMILMGLKIGIGIALGLALLNIAFWACVIIVYGIVWIFESIAKMLK